MAIIHEIRYLRWVVMVFKKYKVSIIIFFVLLVGCMGYYCTGYLVRVNDFWPIYTLAQTFNFQIHDHYYNGFFPILGILFYKISKVPINLILIQLVISIVLLFVLFKTIPGRKNHFPILLIYLSFFPVVKYLYVPGPYIIFSLLCGIAYFFSLDKRFFWTGIFIGLAGCFRLHGYLVLVAFLISVFFNEINKRAVLTLFLGYIIGNSPQLVACGIAGVWPWKSSFSLMNLGDVNWLMFKGNSSTPLEFWYVAKHCVRHLSYRAVWLIPSVILCLKERRLTYSLSIVVCYFILSAPSPSPRIAIAVLPIIAHQVFELLKNSVFYHEVGKKVCFLLFIINAALFFYKNYEINNFNRQIAKVLDRQDKNWRPETIRTNLHHLHFTEKPGYFAIRNGGWGPTVSWYPKNKSEFFNLKDTGIYTKQFKNSDYRYLVLGLTNNKLHRNLYSEKLNKDFKLLDEIEGVKLYRMY